MCGNSSDLEPHEKYDDALRLRPYVARRVIQPELLDTLPAEAAPDNLADMARVNRWFGGFRILLGEVQAMGGTRPLNVLDVAAGGGATGRWLEKRLPRSTVTICDLRPDFLALGSGRRVGADATMLPFRDGSFDVVVSTFFLHHLEEEALGDALREMLRVSRLGVVAVDLVRSRFSYRFLDVTAPVLGWHWLTRIDGARSVQAAFTVKELREVLARQGYPQAKVRSHPPWFRLSVRLGKS